MDGGMLTSEQARTWYGEQDEFGNDLVRLRECLAMTREERYRQHHQALASVLRIREALRIARDRKAS